MSNLAQLRRALGDRWPACKDDLTLEMAFGLDLAEQVFDLDLAAPARSSAPTPTSAWPRCSTRSTS